MRRLLAIPSRPVCTATDTVMRECLHRDAVLRRKFHSRWCIRFSLGQCEADDWISSNDEVCADNHFWFKLKGKGRGEMWEVSLYGDKTIKVDRDSSKVLPKRVPPPSLGVVGFGPSPNLATDRTICELNLHFERGMGMSMNLADPVSSGKYSGT